jgi:hypothetical protein
VFGHDTFAYTNELVWEYHRDAATGEMTPSKREVPSTYTHHCFAMSRSAWQFFNCARFDSSQPLADEVTYRRLVREVVRTNPRAELSARHQTVIPGYSNLFAFSRAHERLLKEECGSARQSYFQRGNWRMVFPMTQAHQERLARQLMAAVRDQPAIVHIVRFPSLSINHAMVFYDAEESEGGMTFTAYDPNVADAPVSIVFDRGKRRFHMRANHYFGGGRVDIYQVYHTWNY